MLSSWNDSQKTGSEESLTHGQRQGVLHELYYIPFEDFHEVDLSPFLVRFIIFGQRADSNI